MTLHMYTEKVVPAQANNMISYTTEASSFNLEGDKPVSFPIRKTNL